MITFSKCLQAQTVVLDSLKVALTKSSTREEKAKTLVNICAVNYSLSTDSFSYYIRQLQQTAIPGTPEYYRSQAYLCQLLIKKGDISRANDLVDSLLPVIPSADDFTYSKFSFQSLKANMLVRTNMIKEAISYYLLSLKEAEAKHDTLWMIKSCNGMVYSKMEMKEYNEAIKWAQKGLAITNNESILRVNGLLFSNLASCFNNLGKKDSAFYYINKALKYGEEEENFLVLANALNIRAAMYEGQRNYIAVENDLKHALEIRKKNYEVDMYVSDLAQLSFFYASINQQDKGIEVANEGLSIINGRKQYSKMIFLNEAIAENYRTAKRYKEYAETLLMIMAYNDTLNQQNSKNTITEMEVKYETEVKEALILRQQLALQRNKTLTIIISLFLLLTAVTGWFIYKSNKQKQDLKLQMALAEEKRNAVASIALAEENERKRIAADLHDNLGSFAAAITSNVKQLNDSRFNSELITQQLEENAQSIVTQLSETIWVLKNNYLPMTQLADRFKIWLQRLLPNYPGVNYVYSEEILNDVDFTPARILNIYMILKECITNSLKHSECSELTIRFFSNDYWEITLEDNGIGLADLRNESTQEFIGGNGIKSIRNRAAENNWQVSWKSKSPQGTIVVISSITSN